MMHRVSSQSGAGKAFCLQYCMKTWGKSTDTLVGWRASSDREGNKAEKWGRQGAVLAEPSEATLQHNTELGILGRLLRYHEAS
jgi:hypothetical protein